LQVAPTTDSHCKTKTSIYTFFRVELTG